MKRLSVTLVSMFVVSLLVGGFLVARGAEAQAPPPGTTQQGADKAFLGVQVSELTSQLADRLGVGNVKGVVVTNVVPLSPAEQAGLRRSDVITAYNSKPVTTPAELSSAVAGSKPGDKVTLTIQRGSQSLSIEATLGKQPTAQPSGPQPNRPQGGPPIPGLRLPRIQIPPLLKELQDIAPVARFNHFFGGTLNFTDKDGKALNLTVTPGVVKTSTSNSITYTPNGKLETVTISVTADVTVLGAGGHKIKPEDIKAEERIIVFSVNNTVRRVRIAGEGIGHMLQERMGQLRKGEANKQMAPRDQIREFRNQRRLPMGNDALNRPGGATQLRPRPMTPSGGPVQ